MSEKREQVVTVAVRLPEEVAAQIDEIARRNYATRSGILRMAIDALLETRNTGAAVGEGQKPEAA